MKKEIYSYGSLNDIRQRKLKLQGDIISNEKRIRQLWQSLFRPEQQTGYQTPSKRLSKFITTGAGLLDGFLLAWKLYRRFIK